VDGIPFGRYQLLALLGRGGMGEVWRAFDTETKRIVAVKVLPALLACDPVFEERFRREAEAVASLTEPHVVPVHNFGEIDGRLYLDMRLVVGRDLASMLSDGPLEPARAVVIVEQVASALRAAHLVGLVHRDVKPSNILVADSDFAYLIDFGIARVAGETGLTSTGSTIGTWAYMAPERFSSANPDSRSDVYALACVLYECLTGQRPFLGDNVEQQVAGHLTTPPPRPSASVNVPVAFDYVINTGMAKNPDERYATTTALAAGARDALSSAAYPSLTEYPADAPTAQGRPPTLWAGADPRASTQSAPSASVELSQTPSSSTTTTARRHGSRTLIGASVVAALLIFLVVGLLWRPWQHSQSNTTASSSSTAPTAFTPTGTTTAATSHGAPPPVTVTASAPAHDPAREKSFLAALDAAAALSGPNHVSYATIPGSHGAYMGDVSAWMPGGSVLKYAYRACAVLARYPDHYEQATDPFYEEVGMPVDVDAKTQQERMTYMQVVGFDLC
jgi:serine/threonine protein kinase